MPSRCHCLLSRVAEFEWSVTLFGVCVMNSGGRPGAYESRTGSCAGTGMALSSQCVDGSAVL